VAEEVTDFIEAKMPAEGDEAKAINISHLWNCSEIASHAPQDCSFSMMAKEFKAKEETIKKENVW